MEIEETMDKFKYRGFWATRPERGHTDHPGSTRPLLWRFCGFLFAILLIGVCIPLLLIYFCTSMMDNANHPTALDTALVSLPIGLETKAAGLGQSWQDSPYVGPRSEADAAWDDLTDGMALKNLSWGIATVNRRKASRVFVSEDEASTLGATHLGAKSKDPRTDVSGYTARVEVFYQLRCLNLLRREAHGNGRTRGDADIGK